MDLHQYTDRLQILLEHNVITRESMDAGLAAFEEMLKLLNKTEIEQGELLFTHLPMALSRIAKGEEVEGPDQEIMEDIKGSHQYPTAKEQVKLIEHRWGSRLPKGEKAYLYMHYTAVLNLNGNGVE